MSHIQNPDILKIKLDNEFKDNTVTEVDEQDRLRFAKQVLIFIGLFSLLACAAYGYAPENTALKQIFELIKIGVLPLVTLIVSFYFPKSK